MIKAILVDDHQIVRDGVNMLLSSDNDINIIGECNSGYEVMDMLDSEDPDVILMDINMPELNGIETIEKALDKKPDLNILALTMHNEQSYISKVLKAGARGYVIKNAPRDELIEAVKTVARGEPFFSEEVSSIMMSRYLKGNKKGNASKNRSSLATVEDLTQREIEVLRLIVGEKTNKEISEQLFISPRTVDSHRRSLLEKLGVKNTAGLVRFALENDIFPDDT